MTEPTDANIAELSRAAIEKATLGKWSPPSGVPEMRLGNRFNTFDLKAAPQMTDAWHACWDVMRGLKWDAFLTGGFGNGKTHLAIAALNEWARQGKYGRFVKAPDWLALMRAHAVVEEGQVDSEFILDQFARAPMLALDDLGSERVTDWGGEQLFRLLDKRYDGRRPTIVTSNATVAGLDPRIVSRLREGLVICYGADLRGKLEAK
jgi:DNA replication protein DnaC